MQRTTFRVLLRPSRRHASLKKKSKNKNKTMAANAAHRYGGRSQIWLNRWPYPNHIKEGEDVSITLQRKQHLDSGSFHVITKKKEEEEEALHPDDRTCIASFVDRKITSQAQSNTIRKEVSVCIEDAISRFDREGISKPSCSVSDFIHILQQCRRSKSSGYAHRVYISAQQGGFLSHRDVGNYIVPMLIECGNVVDAKNVFVNMPYRNVHAWTSFISSYIELGQHEYAFNLYQKMQDDDNVYPNSYTLVALLKACYGVEDVVLTHIEVTEKGFDKDLFVGTSLIDIYAKYGSLPDAHAVFLKLPARNIVSWTALISGYAEHGPNLEALKCFEDMISHGISPNAVTYICVLKACGNSRSLCRGRHMHSEIVQKGLEGDCVVGSTVVDMYVKCASMIEARRTFDKLMVRDIVSWNGLISGYVEHGPDQEALKCLEQMQSEGTLLDDVTFVYTLKACGNMGAIENGWNLHFDVICKGLENDSFIGSTLVDMYAKCGLVSDATKVFEKISVRDVVSWNAIIKGCGMNHDGKNAIRYFEDMQERDVKPDGVTFTCVLTACSHASLALKGRHLFDAMTNIYHIVPTMDHYNCMVDILSRTGRIYEGIKFIESMPCSPSSDMWTALLNACKSYAEIDLGFKCFQELLRIDSEWAVPYVLMTNIYTNAGKFEDACRIEEMRKRAGAKKKPACALIEVNKEVHEFVVGENQNKDISAMLENLNSRLEKEGCIPNLDLVLGLLSDDAKESALCDHAEKLAIAFGLLSTPSGHTLRVTKNMRMCTDCHSRAKAISKMERREIIVREIYQVHRFKDGFCSCGDKC